MNWSNKADILATVRQNDWSLGLTSSELQNDHNKIVINNDFNINGSYTNMGRYYRSKELQNNRDKIVINNDFNISGSTSDNVRDMQY